MKKTNLDFLTENNVDFFRMHVDADKWLIKNLKSQTINYVKLFELVGDAYELMSIVMDQLDEVQQKEILAAIDPTPNKMGDFSLAQLLITLKYKPEFFKHIQGYQLAKLTQDFYASAVNHNPLLFEQIQFIDKNAPKFLNKLSYEALMILASKGWIKNKIINQINLDKALKKKLCFALMPLSLFLQSKDDIPKIVNTFKPNLLANMLLRAHQLNSVLEDHQKMAVLAHTNDGDLNKLITNLPELKALLPKERHHLIIEPLNLELSADKEPSNQFLQEESRAEFPAESVETQPPILNLDHSKDLFNQAPNNVSNYPEQIRPNLGFLTELGFKTHDTKLDEGSKKIAEVAQAACKQDEYHHHHQCQPTDLLTQFLEWIGWFNTCENKAADKPFSSFLLELLKSLIQCFYSPEQDDDIEHCHNIN